MGIGIYQLSTQFMKILFKKFRIGVRVTDHKFKDIAKITIKLQLTQTNLPKTYLLKSKDMLQTFKFIQ